MEEPELLELPAAGSSTSRARAGSSARGGSWSRNGLVGAEWRELKRFYPTPGLAREAMTLLLATVLEEVEGHRPDPEERIEVVSRPLTDLDGLIADREDAKSLIGLYVLRGSCCRP